MKCLEDKRIAIAYECFFLGLEDVMTKNHMFLSMTQALLFIGNVRSQPHTQSSHLFTYCLVSPPVTAAIGHFTGLSRIYPQCTVCVMFTFT